MQFVLPVILMLLAACSLPQKSREGRSPNTHAVQSARLHDLMVRMNSLMYEQVLTNLEVEQQRREHAQDLAEAAARLVQTVDDILGAVPTLRLAPNDHPSFLALAERLRSLAGQLENQTRSNDFGAARVTLDDLGRTCTACHDLFRQGGG